jgi:uncharacterized protein DUF6519
MKDDFTRDTFDPTKHFSRVLMQQGRVTLDADHNEQTDILLYYLRTLARDILGPYAAPSDGGGFRLTSTAAHPLVITAGRLYVDGILVENEDDCPYDDQPDYPLAANDELAKEMQSPAGLSFWVYLDVWERNITWIEDDSIREKALNGPDTCARSKVVWQVKALSATDLNPKSVEPGLLKQRVDALQKELAQTTDPVEKKAIQLKIDNINAALAGQTNRAPVPLTCDAPLSTLPGVSGASMTARVDPGNQIQDPCITSPAAKYRGAENQLYRVEIQTGGTAGTATFKWSRDNGSVATTWLGTNGNAFQVGATRGFTAGAWVELSHDLLDLQGLPGTLVKLAKVDAGALTVDPASIGSASIAWSDQFVNPKVRRWDQHGSDDVKLVNGAIPVKESTAATPVWIDLEDGIQVRFDIDGVYRTGDYWTIPARVATGDIEWPRTLDASGTEVNDAVAPDGIEHHYAPLGIIQWKGGALNFNSCRCEFDPINSCYGKGSMAVGAHLLVPPNTRPALSVERQRQKRPVKKA